MDNYHHALLVRHSPVTEFDINSAGFVDLQQDSYFEKFGINDARELVAAANNLQATGDVQNLAVRADFITLEAQNALLKILEEPPATTRIIFVVPTAFQVLPTLMSRFSVFSGKSSLEESTEAFKVFLTSSHAERIQAVEVAAKKKDVGWQQSIKQGLLNYVSTKKSDNLRELEYIASHLLTRGASNKFLLEHLALTLPVSG